MSVSPGEQLARVLQTIERQKQFLLTDLSSERRQIAEAHLKMLFERRHKLMHKADYLKPRLI